MLTHLLGILAVGALCAAWVAVQRWVAVLDPEQPGVEGHRPHSSHAPSGSPASCSTCTSHHCATCPVSGHAGGLELPPPSKG